MNERYRNCLITTATRLASQFQIHLVKLFLTLPEICFIRINSGNELNIYMGLNVIEN